MSKKLVARPAQALKSYSDIQHDWQMLQSLEIRERYKAMRAIANAICDAYKSEEVTPSRLQFYMQVLKEVNTIHDLPRCKIALSKITTRWLELTGNAAATIVKKVASKINLESASIAVGDFSYSSEIVHAYTQYSDKKILPLINQKKFFVFGTGYDGPHAIQVRLVDSLEPVLSSKEYQCVLNSTETAIIHLPTGTLTVADPCFLESQERLSIHVEPGHYKICVYHFYIHSKVDSFYIALCPTNEESDNTLTRVPHLN